MITPHVIRTPEKLQEMTQDLRDSLRNAGKYLGQKEKEKMRDMKNSQEERNHQEQKAIKKSQPAKSENPQKMEEPQ